MNLKNCRVIVCGPAIGKTYLAEHDGRFFDLDSERAKYKYGLFNATNKELESGKLKRGAIVNQDSTEYTIKKLNEALANGKCVLLSFHEKILKYIDDNQIDYCLVYAGKELANEYAERMKQRENNLDFVNQMTNANDWNNFYDNNINNTKAKYKIELKANQFLSDLVNLFFDIKKE